MFRGTTPVHTFTVPFPPDSIQEVYVTYEQGGETIVEKSIHSVDIVPIEDDEESAQIVTHLTQQNTLAFDEGDVRIQLRVLDKDSEAYASNIVRVKSSQILKDGVIGV